jgi:hypothetical protein
MPVPNGWDYIDGTNNNEYRATLNNQKYENANGFKGTGSLEIVTNRNTGNYIVYQKETFGRTAIYQSVQGSNAPKIESQSLYDSYFGRNADGTKRFSNLDRTVKQKTLQIAESTTLLGDKAQNDAALAALKSDKRYKSLGDNLTPTPETQPPANQGGTQPPNSNGQSDPNQQTGIKDPPTTGDRLNDNDFKGRPVGNIAGGETLTYPLSMPDDAGYDYIKITSHKYAPAGLSFGGSDIQTRIVEDIISTIHLPMLPGMSESNSVSWGGDKVNPLQLIAGKLAMGLISGTGNFNLDELRNAMGTTMKEIQSALSDPNTGPALVAYFAGQAVGANIFTRQTGTIINPNLELLFNGPSLRTFNFNFKLTPRSEDEAKVIRKIIKSFKQNSLPQRSESNLFLLTPNVFRIKYIQGGTDEQHPFMNEIKPCALTSFNVNYAPEGSYMTFRGLPSMTCYEMSMQFSEIQPIYADEIDNSTDSMGY